MLWRETEESSHHFHQLTMPSLFGKSLLRCLVCRDQGFLDIPFTDSNSMALFGKWMIPMKSYKSILLPPMSPFLWHAIALRFENFRIYVQTKVEMNNSIPCQKSEPRHQKIPCDLKRWGAWFSIYLPPGARSKVPGSWVFFSGSMVETTCFIRHWELLPLNTC